MPCLVVPRRTLTVARLAAVKRKIVSYEANSGHQTYVDLFYCISLFGLSNETSSGETTAGNALRYGGRRPERTRCFGRQGLLGRGRTRQWRRNQKAIEGVISDMVFELQSETAERTRARV